MEVLVFKYWPTGSLCHGQFHLKAVGCGMTKYPTRSWLPEKIKTICMDRSWTIHCWGFQSLGESYSPPHNRWPKSHRATLPVYLKSTRQIGSSHVSRVKWPWSAVYYITGWWFQPHWKNENQLGWLFPIYGKIKFMFQLRLTFSDADLLTRFLSHVQLSTAAHARRPMKFSTKNMTIGSISMSHSIAWLIRLRLVLYWANPKKDEHLPFGYLT